MDKKSYRITDLEKKYGGFLGPAIEIKLGGLRLRSSGKYDYSVASVYASGKIAYDGDSAWDSGCAIRPAVWVDVAD